jgi:hypothetical protein
MDMTPFIELFLALGGIAAVFETINLIVHRSAVNSMMQTTTAGINAIVNLTTLSITGTQAETITEVHGVPTTIPKPS